MKKHLPMLWAILITCFALIGTVVMVHFEEMQAVKVQPVRLLELKAAELQTLCGGENAVVEPAYQCYTKRGAKTRVILEKDLK